MHWLSLLAAALSITRRLSETIHYQALIPWDFQICMGLKKLRGVREKRRLWKRRGEGLCSVWADGICTCGKGCSVLKSKLRKKMKHTFPIAKAVVTNAHGSIPDKSFLILWELISESLFSKLRINIKRKKKRRFHAWIKERKIIILQNCKSGPAFKKKKKKLFKYF